MRISLRLSGFLRPVVAAGVALVAVVLAAPVAPGVSAASGSAPVSAPVTSASAADTDVTWSVRPADNKLGGDRPHFTYTLSRGTRVTDGITVTNRGDRAITLRIYASDAFTTASGGLDLLPSDKKPQDVGAWTSPAVDTVNLAPQQSRTVSFTLTVPSDATPGDHTGGIVTSLVTKDDADGVTLDRRLGSRMYLRVPGVLTPALKVGALHARYDGTANPVGTGSTRVTYTVTNTGNIRVTAGQKVRIDGLFGAFSGSAELPDLPEILPGDSLIRSTVIRGVWPAGPMRAHVLLTPKPAEDATAAGQQPMTVPATAAATTTVWAWPWALLVLLLVLAALGYGVFLRRRRNRRVAEAAIETAVAEALASAER